MAKIIYVDHEGTERVVEATNGESVMESAIKNSIPGIDADCGGACACATCHVYVDEAFMEKVGAPEDMEQSMLDFAENVQSNSRLSCQITLNEERDGIKVVVAPDWD